MPADGGGRKPAAKIVFCFFSGILRAMSTKPSAALTRLKRWMATPLLQSPGQSNRAPVENLIPSHYPQATQSKFASTRSGTSWENKVLCRKRAPTGPLPTNSSSHNHPPDGQRACSSSTQQSGKVCVSCKLQHHSDQVLLCWHSAKQLALSGSWAASRPILSG